MRVTLVMSGTTSTERVLLVGDATPDGSAYYVKTETAPPVYLVSNLTIEPLRTWLNTPPIQQPTATPIPVTVVPTAEPTPVGPVGPITGTGTITGTLPITNTQPGAANPTTPEPPTPLVAVTATP
jgi:hypothetical protein